MNACCMDTYAVLTVTVVNGYLFSLSLLPLLIVVIVQYIPCFMLHSVNGTLINCIESVT